MEPVLVYDGTRFCGECDCGCPMAHLDPQTNMVTISDPAKPERGTFTMTKKEYNDLVANAKPIL